MTPDQARPQSLADSFKVGEWLVDPQLDEISRGGEVLKLEPRMMRIARSVRQHEVHDDPQSRDAEGLKGDRKNPGGHGAPLSLGLCTRPRLAHDHERAMRAG